MAARMRHASPILLFFLLAGCATSWQSQLPSAHKYESNPEALQVYLRAYGDGYQQGCQMVTTDFSPPLDVRYTNNNPLLQAAGMDGFNDGQHAAWKIVQEAQRSLKKHLEK